MESVLIICVVLSVLIIISFRLFNCYMLLFKLRVVFYYAFTYTTLQTKNGAIVVSALNYFFLAVSSRRRD